MDDGGAGATGAVGGVQLDGEHAGRSAAMRFRFLLADADATLLSDGGGVDAIHILKALQ